MFFFLLAWAVLLGVYPLDHQFAYLGFAFFLLITALFGGVWWLRRRSIPWSIRLAIAVVPILFAVGLGGCSSFVVFQEKWFLNFAFGVPRDLPPFPPLTLDKLPPSDAKTVEALSSTRSKAAFRQFLGNQRTGYVDDVVLGEDWQSRPPHILWKQSIGLGWSGFAIQEGLAITLEEIEDRDHVTARDVESGRIVWRTPLARRHYHPMGGGGPRATPTIDGDRFYAQSSTGIVCRGELATGKSIGKLICSRKPASTSDRRVRRDLGAFWISVVV